MTDKPEDTPKKRRLGHISTFISAFMIAGGYIAADGVWSFFLHRAPSIFLFGLTIFLGIISLLTIADVENDKEKRDAHVMWSGVLFALLAATAALAGYLWR